MQPWNSRLMITIKFQDSTLKLNLDYRHRMSYFNIGFQDSRFSLEFQSRILNSSVGFELVISIFKIRRWVSRSRLEIQIRAQHFISRFRTRHWIRMLNLEIQVVSSPLLSKIQDSTLNFNTESWNSRFNFTLDFQDSKLNFETQSWILRGPNPCSFGWIRSCINNLPECSR